MLFLLLAVFEWGTANVLFKAGGKVERIGKAAAVGNGFHAEFLGVQQQSFCLGNAQIGEKLQRCFAVLAFEKTAEVVLIKAAFCNYGECRDGAPVCAEGRCSDG